MRKNYQKLTANFPKLTLKEERRLIAAAKKGAKDKAEELVLRHVGFISARINKKAYSTYRGRFGEDLLADAIVILYDKIKTYNLRYLDKHGNFKPVRFSSYIWKRIDGMIIDTLKKEAQKDNHATHFDS